MKGGFAKENLLFLILKSKGSSSEKGKGGSNPKKGLIPADLESAFHFLAANLDSMEEYRSETVLMEESSSVSNWMP